MKNERKRLRSRPVFWLLLALTTLHLPLASANALKKSKSILCADEKCELLYGKGHTLLSYPSPDKDVLGFKKGVPVQIFGKTEDNKHFYVEINKSRGLVPTKHVQEDYIQNPELAFKVDLGDDESSNQQADILGDNHPQTPTLQTFSSPPSSASDVETPSLSSAPPSPINNQPDPSLEFATSKSATVIEGTTFYDEALLKTATPSPTYSASAVTKTATVEVNFTEKEVEHQMEVPAKETPVSVVEAVSKGESGSEEMKESANTSTSDTEMKGKILNLLKAANATTIQLNKSSEPSSSEKLTSTGSEAVSEEASVIDTTIENATSEGDKLISNQSQSSPAEEAVEEVLSVSSSEEIASLQQNDTPVSEESEKKIESVSLPEQVAPVEVPVEAAAQTEPKLDKTPEVKVEEVEKKEFESPPETVISNASTEHEQEKPSNDREAEESFNSLQTENIVQSDNFKADTSEVPSPIVQNQSAESPVADVVKTSENVASFEQQAVDTVIVEKEASPEAAPADTNVLANISETNVAEEPSSPVEPSVLPVVQQTFDSHAQPIAADYLSSPSNVPPPQVGNGGESYTPSPSAGYQVEAKMIPPAEKQPYLKSTDWQSSSESLSSAESVAPAQSEQQKEQQQQAQEENLSEQSEQANAASHHDFHHDHPPPPSNFESNSASVNQPLPDVVPFYPASDALVDPVEYEEKIVSSNNSRRKLLGERVAFVGVIMEIIPDEVELFFESFNISAQFMVFSSIIAFFWSFTKVLTSFVNSSKKQGELRDVTCQVQRKLFYFEAEKDKVKEEATTAKEMLQVREGEIRTLELRRSRLEHENEALKAERSRFTSEIESLRGRASEASHNSSKLNTTLDDLSKLQLEKRDLELLNEELEEKITRLEDEKATIGQTVDGLTDKNKKLTSKSKEIAAENEALSERLKEAEGSCAILQSEMSSLQSQKIALNEELRNLKDSLVSAEEKVCELTETVALQTTALATAQTKISSLVTELDTKNADLASMQLLLSRLNKDISSSQKEKEKAEQAFRRRLSSQLSQQSNFSTDQHLPNGGSLAEANAALDALNGNVLEESALQMTSDDQDEENNVTDLQDIVKLQLRLTNIELEKGQLLTKIKGLETALETSKSELATLRKTNVALKEETDAACRERLKAVTELEVLSKYYKEKELEYGKEIGVQRVKRELKEEDANSLEGKLKSYLEENEMLAEHLKSTKKELEETESRYKGQLNSLEKQSHENWIASRHFKRMYEESMAEATALRQTLTMSVKSPPPSDISLSNYLFDDSASSVSDHAGGGGSFLHNSSLGGVLGGSMQLPPPPPPPPLMMMNPMGLAGGHIPPPPGHSAQMTAYGGGVDMSGSESLGGPFWASGQNSANHSGPSSLNMMGHHQQNQQPLPSTSLNTSADSSMVFAQSSPAYAQHNQQQNLSVNNNCSSAQYTMPQQQQQQYHQQSWEDLNRNTYSPALSQRSATATPHTAAQAASTTTSGAYNAPYGNAPYGNAPYGNNGSVHYQQNQQAPPSTSLNTSADSSMVFVQSSPAYAQHNQQQNLSVNNNNSSAQYTMPQQQQQYHQQSWEDLNRNTYSPALSQRSATATPHTAAQAAPTTTSGVYNAPYGNIV